VPSKWHLHDTFPGQTQGLLAAASTAAAAAATAFTAMAMVQSGSMLMAAPYAWPTLRQFAAPTFMVLPMEALHVETSRTQAAAERQVLQRGVWHTAAAAEQQQQPLPQAYSAAAAVACSKCAVEQQQFVRWWLKHMQL